MNNPSHPIQRHIVADEPRTTIEISVPEKLAKAPLVSIYMLAFKHELYIAKAIEGVLAQRCSFPIELIIGEDCSPDRTGEIVRSYQARHPHLIRMLTSNVNVGAHANAARCRSACRGEFIAICEGDDYWHHPEKIQMQVDLMLANPNMTLCHTEFDRRIGFRIKRNRHRQIHSHRKIQGEVYISLLHEWTVMTATALYRKQIMDDFQTSPFYERRWPFGDYNLALYASKRGIVGYIPISTATWRRVSGSASNSGPTKSLAMHQAASECRHRYLQVYPVDGAQTLSIEHAIHRKSLKLAYWAIRADVYRTSLNWLIEQGFESDSARHKLKLLTIRLRFPIRLANTMRTFLRSLAELDPTVGRTEKLSS